MTIRAIVGGNWGDEGKGKMIDNLAATSDYVVRYQGGNNAGHTIINDYGKFQLHLLPSGVFYENVTNILSNGIALNIKAFLEEYNELISRNVPTPIIKVSSNAQVVMDHHILFDKLEEKRLGDDKFGSTQSGISPFYKDKYAKVGIRVSDLFHKETLLKKVEKNIEHKNILLEHLYTHSKLNASDITDELFELGIKIKPFVADTTKLLNDAITSGENILFEGQLGALKDPDHGIYPMTTSSSTLASFATTSCGVPAKSLDEVITVIKAYSTSVGSGPLVSEIFGAEAEHLRSIGGDSGEYGATTGRPRRIGWFDVVASKYGCMIQGTDAVVLSLLDVLSEYPTIKVCESYLVDGKVTTDFPTTDKLEIAEPIWKELKGWETDISEIRVYSQLPKEAKEYVEYIEESIGYPIKYISVGPSRDDLIDR